MDNTHPSLPPAAQRWLARALPPGYKPPDRIRLHQEGELEVRGRWTPFTAQGIYHASPLAFQWRARLRALPGVWINAEDGHQAGEAWGGARLWGIIPMGRRTGREVLTSQMVRNLGELPWLPGFVADHPSLEFGDQGDSAFEIRSQAGEQRVSVRFEVDEQGDVTRTYSPARPYDIPKGFAEAPWHITFSDHQEISGVRIPTAAVAVFDKAGGPWEYLRIRVTGVAPARGSTNNF